MSDERCVVCRVELEEDEDLICFDCEEDARADAEEIEERAPVRPGEEMLE